MPRPDQLDAPWATLAAGRTSIVRLEYSCDGSGPTTRWFQLRLTRFGCGPELRFVLAHEEITELKRSQQSLHTLTASLLRAQDEERRRITRELHDSTAQNLLAARLGISRAVELSSLTGQAAEALAQSEALIEQSQREIRTVSYLLHPPMLEANGLSTTLRWFCEGFAKRTGIETKFETDNDMDRLPPDLELALFRVVQEGLTNIHRHSGSPTAQVRLERGRTPVGADLILLTIADQGRGMPAGADEHAPATLPANAGVGFLGMQERLRQLDGRIKITSSGTGTVVFTSAPICPPMAA